MTIEQYANNGVNGWRIIDEKGEHFEPLGNSSTQEIAIEKFNAMRLKQANPLPPSYQELRRKEYPSIANQLDMRYWDSVNGTHKWEELITSIKEKYPKE
jgi:hypothetical protein